MGSLEDEIEKTKGLMTQLIKKPKMSDKLLSRPPFRFLHDTVMAVNGKTGFVDLLFSQEEKEAGGVKDKAVKVGFLTKLIDFAGVCSGTSIDVRAAKIVSGSEPENTNALLQALAEAALDSSIDFAKAAALAQAGAAPGQVPRTSAEEVAPPPSPEESKEEAAAPAPAPTPAVETKQQDEEEEQGEGEAGEAKESGGDGLDLGEVDGEVATTMRLFEGLIRKPKLSEKLLGRPPFRFLFDVITNLNASTGIVEGLFEGDELDVKAISNKEGKVGYLGKLVSFTTICAGAPTAARPVSIVQGHEADKTNEMLQTLALIARNKGQGAVPAAAAVQAALGSDDGKSERKLASRGATREAPAKKSSGEAKEADGQGAEAQEAEEGQEQEQEQEQERERQEVQQPSTRKTSAARPQTARKRPPKIRDGATEVSAASKAQARQASQEGPVGVMMDGQDDESSEDEGDDAAAAAARADDEGNGKADDNPALDGGSRNGLKGKLVRDIMEDEEKQQREEKEMDKSKGKGDAEERPTSSGITMGKVGRGLTRRGSSKAGSGGAAGGVGVVDVDKMRSAVQMLCQSTNPLGKCMDYVHEDLSIMAKELDKWKAEYRKSCDDLEDEQRTTSETLLPLRARLTEVDENIKDKDAKLATLKASTAKNDQRIAELLQDMVLGQ